MKSDEPDPRHAGNRHVELSMRDRIEDLHKRFRDFYAIGYLMPGEKLQRGEAEQLASEIERGFKEILAEITDADIRT